MTDDSITGSSSSSKEPQGKPWLELVVEKKLYGSIESLACVRFPDSTRDSLILSFKDAKVSILEYNPATLQLEVTSLHYYERDDLKMGRASFRSPPLLKSLGIENVKDFCFLAGYYEPTVLFLHEPSQTWTSRISVKKFTCILTSVALNLSQRLQNTIWNIEGFPYNCERLISVPDPIGGAMVVTPNILFYVNQSSRYGLGANEYAITDTGDQFQFTIDSTSTNLVFTLDCANFVFLESDRLMASLKSGEFVLSSNICVLTPSLLFLGSRLGDSVLFQYSERNIAVEDSTGNVENLSNPYKKQKTSEVLDILEASSDDETAKDEEEDDEDAIFNQKKNQLKSYQLKICDHISNIGPISDMIAGISYDSASLSNSYGVRPDLITTIDWAGVKQLWTLYYEDPLQAKKRQNAETTDEANWHSFLIVSFETETLVVRTGAILEEVAKFPEPTVCAGNIFGKKCIVQVHPNGWKLLQLNNIKSKHFTEIQKDDKMKPIKMSYILDPYVLILHDDGTIVLYRGDSGVSQLMEFKDFPVKSDIVSCSLFADSSVKPFFSDNGLELVYTAAYLNREYEVLGVPSHQIATQLGHNQSKLAPLDTSAYPVVVELSIQFLGNSMYESPYLVTLNELEDITVYKAFKIDENDQTNHIKFTKIQNERSITSFTPFNNVNCSNGFIYSTEAGSLRFCQLPKHMNFENDWPIRKIPLRNTCHKITFHQESKCYILVLSYPQAPPEEEDEEKEKSRKPLILEEKFQLKLIDPERNWEIVDSFSLSEKETVLSTKIILLKHTDAEGTRQRPFLCVGTAYTHGEDTVCKGRILIFEIVAHRGQHAAPVEDGGEQEEPQLQQRLNLLYEKDQKGPVTALSGLHGLLIMSIGPKLIVNNFSTGELVGISFFDTQIFIVNINTVKNYILVGDMYKSICFFKLKDGRKLMLLGKDYEALNTFSTEFVVNENVLSLVVSDLEKNIRLFSFDPKDPESMAGQMLLARTNFHIASNTNKFIRIPMKNEDGTTKKERHLLVFGTLDGGVHALVPLDTQTFQHLQHLQSRMFLLTQTAGLNPRAFRQKTAHQYMTRGQAHNIIDGDLVSQFISLSKEDARQVAQSLSTTPTQIINQLNSLSNSYNLF
eukprot:gene8360-9819_t